jgi:hypothetical protein
MIHGVNTTGFILGEMELAEAALSLQRIGTLPMEKHFGVTRMHMGTHQTMMAALQTMEHRQATKLLHENQHIVKRQLYDEIAQRKDERVDLDERNCIAIAKPCIQAGILPLSEGDTVSGHPVLLVFVEFIAEHLRPDDRPLDDGPRM